MRRVLVAVDDGEASRRVADFVNRFFDGIDVEVIALNVGADATPWVAYPVAVGMPYPWTPPAVPMVAGELRVEALRTAAAEGADAIARTGLHDDEEVVDLGDPVEVIRRVAVERDVALIVVGSSHKGLLERLVTGSVPRALVAESPRPVL